LNVGIIPNFFENFLTTPAGGRDKGSEKMAKNANSAAVGKTDPMSKVVEDFGEPKKPLSNPQRITISSATCGELQVRFESVEWLNKDDPTRYDFPIPSFVAYVDGYKNKNGYRQEIALSGDPADLDNLIQVLQSVSKFVKDTNVNISKSAFFKDDISKAYEKFAPNGRRD
jgi:hypothetical protein